MPNPVDGGAMWYAVEDAQSAAPQIVRRYYSREIDMSSVISGEVSNIDFGDILSKSAEAPIRIGDLIIQAGVYFAPNLSRITISGSITSAQGGSVAEVILGDDCVFGGALDSPANLSKVSVTLSPTSKRSVVENLKIRHTEALKLGYAVYVACDYSNRPYKCVVRNIDADVCRSAIHVSASLECEFRNLTYRGSDRGAVVYSSEASVFEDIETSPSGELPIVGFLNISTITKSHGRGFIGNTYRNVSINGWREEGFSFDLRGNEAEERAHRLNSHVLEVTAQGIKTVSPVLLYGTQYSVTFHTGDLAGQQFDILSQDGNDFSLGGFAGGCDIGDFVSVGITCKGNEIYNLDSVSSGDPSGLIFFAFGAETKVYQPRMDGCNIEIYLTAFNKPYPGIETCFYAPHGIKIERPEFSRPWLDGVRIDREDWNYEARQSDDSIPKNDVLILDCEIIGSDSVNNVYEAVGRLALDTVNPGDTFLACSGAWAKTLALPHQLTPAQAAATTA